MKVAIQTYHTKLPRPISGRSLNLPAGEATDVSGQERHQPYPCPQLKE